MLNAIWTWGCAVYRRFFILFGIGSLRFVLDTASRSPLLPRDRNQLPRPRPTFAQSLFSVGDDVLLRTPGLASACCAPGVMGTACSPVAIRYGLKKNNPGRQCRLIGAAWLILYVQDRAPSLNARKSRHFPPSLTVWNKSTAPNSACHPSMIMVVFPSSAGRRMSAAMISQADSGDGWHSRHRWAYTEQIADILIQRLTAQLTTSSRAESSGPLREGTRCP